MKKFEKLNTTKFKQLDNKSMSEIKGGERESSRYTPNTGGGSYWDSFTWTNLSTPSATMDNKTIYWNHPVTN